MTMIVSCEHASNRVPEPYTSLFRHQREVLASHLAYDLGAAELARFLGGVCKAPLFLSSISRLVMDCNRSATHPGLFSRFTRGLPPMEKEALMADWYLPYRGEVYRAIKQTIAHAGLCLHLSVHTFTPELNGQMRNAEAGLLYDPTRKRENLFARTFQAKLQAELPSCRARRNYPYRGVSDGLTAALRRSFAAEHYIGIELEVNQALLSPSLHWPHSFLHSLGEILKKTIENSCPAA